MKNKKIIFFSEVPGLDEAVPIIPARKQKYKWAELSKQDYLERLKINNESDKFQHLYRCPGIFEIMQEGYIVPMWHDLNITTNGDKKTFEWEVPGEALQDFMESPIVGAHTINTKNLPYPKSSLECIIKLNTPWNIIAPKNLRLLILPITYPDTTDFTATPGILDPGYSNEVNIQLYWHKLNGKSFIKAGTPMMQIIPLSEKKYDLVCRYKTELDELWLKKKKFMQNFTFWYKKHISKKTYQEHFKDEN